MKENQHAAHRILSRRRQVALFNAKIETQYEGTAQLATGRRQPVRVAKDAMEENQYATAYIMLPRRRKAASFNAKAETQNEQASSPEGDANQSCWRYEGVHREVVERKRWGSKSVARAHTPIGVVSSEVRRVAGYNLGGDRAKV
jgi:hypothetical protein